MLEICEEYSVVSGYVVTTQFIGLVMSAVGTKAIFFTVGSAPCSGGVHIIRFREANTAAAVQQGRGRSVLCCGTQGVCLFVGPVARSPVLPTTC